MGGVGAVLLQVQQLQAQAFTGRARSHAGRIEALQGLQGGFQFGREIGGGKSPDGRGIVGVLAFRGAGDEFLGQGVQRESGRQVAVVAHFPDEQVNECTLAGIAVDLGQLVQQVLAQRGRYGQRAAVGFVVIALGGWSGAARDAPGIVTTRAAVEQGDVGPVVGRSDGGVMLAESIGALAGQLAVLPGGT